MTDLEKLSEELASKYARENTLGCCTPKDAAVGEHEYTVCACDFEKAHVAGFQSCLDLLAEQGEVKLDFFKGKGEHSVNELEKMVSDRSAALLAANAKIAKLEEEINLKDLQIKSLAASDTLKKADLLIAELQQRVKELSHSTVLAANQVLQERVRELESEVEDRKESYSKLDDFNINLNEKIKELERENEKLNDMAKFTAMYYNPKDTRFQTMVHNFMSLTDEQKSKLIEVAKNLKDLSDLQNKGG